MTLLFGASVIKLSECMYKAKVRVGEYTCVQVYESSPEAWTFVHSLVDTLDEDSLGDATHVARERLTILGFSHDPHFLC